ncbi:START-like domain-containing protein [Fluviicola chungangensis]|uniref:SRPBCC domain-containing protein n=1 Tax=Fluviicola chungangensis TaxID=2597671 RepID=A0A556N6R8_9FLAO|nr:START-like domain-containing protein [Fluviicola chungangensis]TSJ47773.1 SRPBCC domain-containing protein [Fluviicola chungangensis]
MTKKEQFELEYVLKTSPRVLDKLLSTPDGLSEWFADDVIVKDDMYTFHWDGSEEQARLISKKAGEYIKWQWLNDEEDELETFFEMKYTIDPMTKVVILTVSDFAEKTEKDEIVRLWESQISDLRRVIGA